MSSLATAGGVLVAVYVFTRYLLPYLWPFVLGLLIALAIEPVVGALQRLRLRRSVAVSLALLLVLGLFAALLTWAVSALVVEITKLVDALPQYYSLAQDLVAQITDWVGRVMASLPGPVKEQIFAQLARFYEVLASLLTQLLNGVAKLPELLLVILVAAIASYFISRDKKVVGGFFLLLLPPTWRASATHLNKRLISSVWGFALAQLWLIIVTTLVTMGGLAVMGAPYALLLGLLSGLLDILPVVGPGLLFLPWALYNLVWGQFVMGVELAVLYLVISVLRQMLSPRLVGERLGIHPLAALLSMYVGAKLLGLLGLAMGPLAVMLLGAMHQTGILDFGNGGRPAPPPAPPPEQHPAAEHPPAPPPEQHPAAEHPPAQHPPGQHPPRWVGP